MARHTHFFSGLTWLLTGTVIGFFLCLLLLQQQPHFPSFSSEKLKGYRHDAYQYVSNMIPKSWKIAFIDSEPKSLDYLLERFEYDTAEKIQKDLPPPADDFSYPP